jgi:hypothetical protein
MAMKTFPGDHVVFIGVGPASESSGMVVGSVLVLDFREQDEVSQSHGGNARRASRRRKKLNTGLVLVFDCQNVNPR